MSILKTLQFNCWYFLANYETRTISLRILIANKVREIYCEYYVWGINWDRIQLMNNGADLKTLIRSFMCSTIWATISILQFSLSLPRRYIGGMRRELNSFELMGRLFFVDDFRTFDIVVTKVSLFLAILMNVYTEKDRWDPRDGYGQFFLYKT